MAYYAGVHGGPGCHAAGPPRRRLGLRLLSLRERLLEAGSPIKVRLRGKMSRVWSGGRHRLLLLLLLLWLLLLLLCLRVGHLLLLRLRVEHLLLLLRLWLLLPQLVICVCLNAAVPLLEWFFTARRHLLPPAPPLFTPLQMPGRHLRVIGHLLLLHRRRRGLVVRGVG